MVQASHGHSGSPEPMHAAYQEAGRIQLAAGISSLHTESRNGQEKTMTRHFTRTGLHHLRDALGLSLFALGAVILGSGTLF